VKYPKIRARWRTTDGAAGAWHANSTVHVRRKGSIAWERLGLAETAVGALALLSAESDRWVVLTDCSALGICGDAVNPGTKGLKKKAINEAVGLICECRERGLEYAKIAEQLNARGLTTRLGKPWSTSSVGSTLQSLGLLGGAGGRRVNVAGISVAVDDGAPADRKALRRLARVAAYTLRHQRLTARHGPNPAGSITGRPLTPAEVERAVRHRRGGLTAEERRAVAAEMGFDGADGVEAESTIELKAVS
jgi:hypothetical protein